MSVLASIGLILLNRITWTIDAMSMEFLAYIGRKVTNFLSETGQIMRLFGSVLRYLPQIPKNSRLILNQMKVIGADSLPLVVLIGIFTGAIAAVEATDLFIKFNLLGLAKPFIGSSIATAVFTELTPVLTALVIAVRIGGAMAAEIGTMKVTEQIDALEMMAIDKARYLVMPRLVAAIFMMPVLAVFSNLVALAGGFALTLISFDFSFGQFFDSVQRFFRIGELLTGIVKTMVFGGITTIIGCHVGFSTAGGAEGVGQSTVRAYTLSAALILIADAVIGAII